MGSDGQHWPSGHQLQYVYWVMSQTMKKIVVTLMQHGSLKLDRKCILHELYLIPEFTFVCTVYDGISGKHISNIVSTLV